MTPQEFAFATGLLSAAGVYVLVLATLSTDYDWWPPGDRTPAYYSSVWNSLHPDQLRVPFSCLHGRFYRPSE